MNRIATMLLATSGALSLVGWAMLLNPQSLLNPNAIPEAQLALWWRLLLPSMLMTTACWWAGIQAHRASTEGEEARVGPTAVSAVAGTALVSALALGWLLDAYQIAPQGAPEHPWHLGTRIGTLAVALALAGAGAALAQGGAWRRPLVAALVWSGLLAGGAYGLSTPWRQTSQHLAAARSAIALPRVLDLGVAPTEPVSWVILSGDRILIDQRDLYRAPQPGPAAPWELLDAAPPELAYHPPSRHSSLLPGLREAIEAAPALGSRVVALELDAATPWQEVRFLIDSVADPRLVVRSKGGRRLVKPRFGDHWPGGPMPQLWIEGTAGGWVLCGREPDRQVIDDATSLDARLGGADVDAGPPDPGPTPEAARLSRHLPLCLEPDCLQPLLRTLHLHWPQAASITIEPMADQTLQDVVALLAALGPKAPTPRFRLHRGGEHAVHTIADPLDLHPEPAELRRLLRADPSASLQVRVERLLTEVEKRAPAPPPQGTRDGFEEALEAQADPIRLCALQHSLDPGDEVEITMRLRRQHNAYENVEPDDIQLVAGAAPGGELAHCLADALGEIGLPGGGTRLRFRLIFESVSGESGEGDGIEDEGPHGGHGP